MFKIRINRLYFQLVWLIQRFIATLYHIHGSNGVYYRTGACHHLGSSDRRAEQ
ncbi:MAG: hypothetical protein K2L89_08390 [Muribaculaceae bacterium]|nr:hypothetical protein [Muribaculaceae bacterium]